MQMCGRECTHACVHAYMYVVFMSYVCLYVCMYVCKYVCMHVCMHVSTFVCMYVCISVSMYVRTYSCNECMYVSVIHRRMANLRPPQLSHVLILHACAMTTEHRAIGRRKPRAQVPATLHPNVAHRNHMKPLRNHLRNHSIFTILSTKPMDSINIIYTWGKSFFL